MPRAGVSSSSQLQGFLQLQAPYLPLPFALFLELRHPFGCYLGYSSAAGTSTFSAFVYHSWSSLPPPPIPPELPVTPSGSYEVSAVSISLPDYVRGLVLLGFTLLTQWRDAPASKRGLSFHSDSVSGGKGQGER